MKTKKAQSKFTEALAVTLSQDGWVLPESHALQVYDEHVKRLEAEIDVLTGGRSNSPTRINPMDGHRGKQIPS